MLTMYGIDTSGCYRRTAGSAAPHTPCVRQHSQQHWSTVQFCARDFAAFRERNPSSSLDDRGHHSVPSHPKVTLNGDGNLRGWRAGGHSQPQGFIAGAGVGLGCVARVGFGAWTCPLPVLATFRTNSTCSDTHASTQHRTPTKATHSHSPARQRDAYAEEQ